MVWCIEIAKLSVSSLSFCSSLVICFSFSSEARRAAPEMTSKGFLDELSRERVLTKLMVEALPELGDYSFFGC